MNRKIANSALNRLAVEESAFLAMEFLAPVVRGRNVALKIAEVRLALRVQPDDFHGWGFFCPMSHTSARAVRIPTMEDRRAFLDALPTVRFIATGRGPDSLNATPANQGDHRYVESGSSRVLLAFQGDMFDTVIARFDGRDFWFDKIDPAADRGVAHYLRRSLAQLTPPRRLARAGLSGGHRSAYAERFEFGMKHKHLL